MKKQTILITGAGFVNKGAEAMLLTLVDAIRARNAQQPIAVSVHPEYESLVREYGLEPVATQINPDIVAKLKSKVCRFNLYRKCAAVLDIGGYQFADKWGPEKAKRIFAQSKKWKLLNVPTYYLPQAWGPFSDPKFTEIIPKIIDEAAMCFVRDNISRECLANLGPEVADKCRFSHDIAWLFKGGDQDWAKQYLAQNNITCSDGKILVCITPNMRMYEKYNCQDSENPYLNYLDKLIKYLAEFGNIQVVLMGHELKLHKADKPDDRYLCQYLYEKNAGLDDIYCLTDYLTAAQVKAILGCCDLLISSRYHALIAALSQGIPSIALGWSHKYDELMKSVGMGDYILHLQNDFDDQLLNTAITNKHRLHETILTSVVSLKDSAEKTLDEVLTAIIYSRVGQEYGKAQ